MEQYEFFGKLAGAEVRLIGTSNMKRLHTIKLRTTEGEDVYIEGDMVCMTTEEWLNKKSN